MASLHFRPILIAYLLLAVPAVAQRTQPDIGFDHITSQDGLSQNAVHSVLQDRRGYLWIATEDGLNRYDGYSFTVYRRELAESEQRGIEPHRVEHPGLPDSLVRVLSEDSDGSLWIGTADGVARLMQPSGSFRHYRPRSEASGDPVPISVWDIEEDREGRLWVGANPGGLSQLDPTTGRFEHHRHDPRGSSTLSSNNITGIAMTSDGILWVGTGDAGLNRFDPATGQVRRYSHDPLDAGAISGSQISDLVVDSRGLLWIATQDAGLSRFDPDTGEVQRYFHDTDDPGSLSSNAVRTVHEDSQQRLWIGHYPTAGLDLFDRDSGQFFNYTHRTGVDRTLSDNQVISVFEDDSGILWFGTSVGGLNQYNPSQNQFRHYRNEWWTTNSLNNNTVRAFHKGDQRLYIGTAGGLNVLDLRSGDFTHHVHDPERPGSIPSDVVRDIAPDGDGRLWLATHGGLSRFDPDTQQFSNYFHDPQDAGSLSTNLLWRVHVDRNGMVWAGSRGQLNRLDPQTGMVQRIQASPDDPDIMPVDWLLAMHEDASGDLWFGANRYNPDSDTFSSYAPEPDQSAPISNAIVMSIAEEEDGTLWFGTRGGLNRLDDREAGHFTQFTTEDGLPNDVIYGLLFDDDGGLWLSTNSGIARFDPDSGEVSQFDTSHGLQADEFNNGAYYRADSGEMYFGGSNGFNVFDPSRISQSDYAPPLVITRFLVLNEERSMEQPDAESGTEALEIALGHAENYLSFEFAALDYSAPERLRYEYRLEGFNEGWVAAGDRRFAEYTNLSPGRYRFVVRGTNRDGIWSPHTAELSFRIMPVFWQTLWFRVSLLVMATAAVFLLYQYKLFSIRRQNAALEAQVRERTGELEEANARLRSLSLLDGLLGVHNRRAFDHDLQTVFNEARADRGYFQLLLIDVDEFKRFNDTYGHLRGDDALIRLARCLQDCIRDTDRVYRYGGEELAVILSQPDAREAAAAAERMLEEIRHLQIPFPESEAGIVTVSAGLASYSAAHENPEDLIREADRLLYQAKADGRNRLCS
ncbi:MAG: two-component regulator propeller domain-containing protein [Pseudohongiellaceae bacterium]